MNSPTPVWINFATSEYRRTGAAFFLAGFATFSMLYCVQPLLPLFAADFGVSPAESSLTLSLATGTLAVSVAAGAAFSQAIGRRGLMFASMALAAMFNLIAGIAPDWHTILAARALEGFVLGGLPAVAMAYVAEEIEPAHLGRSMGLYVAGTAIGDMMGRIGMGILSEFLSWRVSIVVLSLYCFAAAVGFRLLLPPSRNFIRRPGLNVGMHLSIFRRHLCTPGLLRIYFCAFFAMSVFVTLFNYTTFRFSQAPYLLSQAAISTIFLAYGLGAVSSSIGGALADRFGARPLLLCSLAAVICGTLLTLADPLIVVVIGLVVMTIGYFIVHAVNSASVGPLAGEATGHASALYLLFYYLGSSISGTAGGWMWEHGGWPAVVAFTGLCGLLALTLIFTARPRPTGRPAGV
ncbi:MAG: MFS transporter [Rhodospirillaceae bacterium]